MDIFIIVISAIIVLFLVFLVLNLSHNNQQQTEKKAEQKKPEVVAEPKPVSVKEAKTSVKLTSRPDFSDLIPEKKEVYNPKNKNRNYEEINGGRLKVLKESNGIKKETDLYNKKTSNSKNLAKEIKELSPEMKTVMFGKVLDKID